MPRKGDTIVSGKSKHSSKKEVAPGDAASSSSSSASPSTSSSTYNRATGKIKMPASADLTPPTARIVVKTGKDDMLESVVLSTKCIRYRVAEPKLECYGGGPIEGQHVLTEFGRKRLNCNISFDSAKLQLLSSLSQCMLWYLETEIGNASFFSARDSFQSTASSSDISVENKVELPRASSSSTVSASSTSAPVSGAVNKHAEVQIGCDDNGLYVASNAGAIAKATYLAMIDAVKRLPPEDPDHERPVVRAMARIQELFGAEEMRNGAIRVFSESQEKKKQERLIARARRAKGGMSEEELERIAEGQLKEDSDNAINIASMAFEGALQQSHWFRNVVHTIGRTNDGELAKLYLFLKVLREGTGIEESRAHVNDASWAGPLPILHAELRVVRAAWLAGSGNLLLSGAKRACWSCNSVLGALDEIAKRPTGGATSSSSAEPHSMMPAMMEDLVASSASSVAVSSSSAPRAPHVPQLFDILRLIDENIPGGAFPGTYCGVLDDGRKPTDGPNKENLSTHLTRRRSVIRFV